MNSMSEVATKNDIVLVRKDIEEVLLTMQDFMHQVDDRFNKIEKEIINLKDSHNQLLNTIDGFVARLDKNELEYAAGQYQFQKLLDWARMVSKKTGIPIKDL